MPGALWSDLEKNLLRQLVKRGLGPIRIKRQGHYSSSGQTARSIYGISRQAQRLSLVNPEASKRVSLGRRRSITVEKQHGATLTLYLLKHGRIYPTWYIARKWQLSETMIRHRLHKLGIHRTWAESVALPLARFKLPQYRRELSATLKRRSQVRKQQRWIDFERRTREVHLHNPEEPQRVCEQCLVARPLVPKFFPAFQNSANGKTYYSYRCRRCISERKLAVDGQSHANPKTLRLANKLSRLRTAYLNYGVPLKQRTCIRCQETWPLLEHFWRACHSSAGNRCFDHRCRLCANTVRRERRRSLHARK